MKILFLLFALSLCNFVNSQNKDFQTLKSNNASMENNNEQTKESQLKIKYYSTEPNEVNSKNALPHKTYTAITKGNIVVKDSKARRNLNSEALPASEKVQQKDIEVNKENSYESTSTKIQKTITLNAIQIE